MFIMSLIYERCEKDGHIDYCSTADVYKKYFEGLPTPPPTPPATQDDCDDNENMFTTPEDELKVGQPCCCLSRGWQV